MLLFVSFAGCTEDSAGIIEDAVREKDQSKCSVIENDERREYCLMKVGRTSRDPKACDKITIVNYKDSCLSGVAVKKMDRKICERISDPDIMTMCISQIQ